MNFLILMDFSGIFIEFFGTFMNLKLIYLILFFAHVMWKHVEPSDRAINHDCRLSLKAGGRWHNFIRWRIILK